MLTRESTATWNGSIGDGSGTMRFGEFEGTFSVPSRFDNEEGTNPEEMLAAAHAGCFSMQLSALLTRAGHAPERIDTSAVVTLDRVGEGWGITKIALSTVGHVSGIDEATFRDHANTAKDTCPVSQALAAVPDITLEASLSA